MRTSWRAGCSRFDRRGIWILVTAPVAAFLLVAGAMCVALPVVAWYRAHREAAAWERTTCVVLESKLRPEGGLNARVQYETPGGKQRRWTVAGADLGDTVEGWYRRENPSQVRLEAPEGPPEMTLLAPFAVAGVVLFALGAAMLAGIRRGLRAPTLPPVWDRPAVTPGSAGSTRVESHEPRLRLLAFFAVHTAAYLFLAVGLLYAVGASTTHGLGSRLMAAFFGLGFLVVGVRGLAETLLRTYAYAGRSVPVVELDRWPLPTDEPVDVVVRLTGWPLPAGLLEVHVACETTDRRRRFVKGKPGFVHYQPVLRVESAPTADPVRLKAQFVVPGDVAEVNRYGEARHTWKLQLTWTWRGFVVLDESYPLQLARESEKA